MAPDDSTPPPIDDATPPPVDDRTATDRGSSTALNALVGGIAGVILSFVPFSTILGGAVAGYLEGGDTDDGLKVGAIAGLVMLVPFAFFGILLLFVLGFAGAPASFGLLGLVALLFVTLYTVGLSALGGVLGIYLKDEF